MGSSRVALLDAASSVAASGSLPACAGREDAARDLAAAQAEHAEAVVDLAAASDVALQLVAAVRAEMGLGTQSSQRPHPPLIPPPHESSAVDTLEPSQVDFTATDVVGECVSSEIGEAAEESMLAVEAPPLLLPSPDTGSAAAADGVRAPSSELPVSRELTDERRLHSGASSTAAMPLAPHATRSVSIPAGPAAQGSIFACQPDDHVYQALDLQGDDESRKCSVSGMGSCSDGGHPAGSGGSGAEAELAPVAEVLQRCLVRRLLAHYHCTSRACLRYRPSVSLRNLKVRSLVCLKHLSLKARHSVDHYTIQPGVNRRRPLQ